MPFCQGFQIEEMVRRLSTLFGRSSLILEIRKGTLCRVRPLELLNEALLNLAGISGGGGLPADDQILRVSKLPDETPAVVADWLPSSECEVPGEPGSERCTTRRFTCLANVNHWSSQNPTSLQLFNGDSRGLPFEMTGPALLQEYRRSGGKAQDDVDAHLIRHIAKPIAAECAY